MAARDLQVRRHGDGWQAHFGSIQWRCSVGRNGTKTAKVEGDGATPVGDWPLRRVLYRADRLAPPRTAMICRPVSASDAWCDDPKHRMYNRQITLPSTAHHERLWRDDDLYDIVVILGHNDSPPRPYAGSAVFLHVAAPDFRPTDGCVAMRRADLLAFLALAEPTSRLSVRAD